MTRARQLLVICALGCTLGPRALHAQSADEPWGRFELSGGAAWTGTTNFGDQPATETALAGERFELFSTSTTLASTPDLVAALGVRLARSIEGEVMASFGRPRLRTVISGDAEGASDLTVEETVQRVSIAGSLRWRFSRWRLAGRGQPFASGGGGYLRELHEGATLSATGHTYHAGLGLEFPLTSGDGRLKAAGIRTEARLVFREAGVGTDSKLHGFPSLGASVFFRF